MLTQGKHPATLTLSSYKLDTRGFDERIRELTLENKELQSLLENCRVREKQLFEELKNTKQQVASLRTRLTNQYVVHDQKCRNCARFSLKNIDRLGEELERERQRVKEYRQMYQNAEINKREQSQYYEKRLSTYQREKDNLVKEYESRIALSSREVVTPSLSSSTSLRAEASRGRDENKMPVSLKKIPPSPKKGSLKAHKSQQVVKTQDTDQQSLIEMVSPIKENLQKMQITLKELTKIPQVVRFTQSFNPPKNRFVKLFREYSCSYESFPFECKDEDAMLQSYDFVCSELYRRGEEESGENMLRVVLRYLNRA